MKQASQSKKIRYRAQEVEMQVDEEKKKSGRPQRGEGRVFKPTVQARHCAVCRVEKVIAQGETASGNGTTGCG